MALAAVLAAVALSPASAPAAVHTGADGRALIRHFEGFAPRPYRDPVGIVTQCYGATGAELQALPPVATDTQCRTQLRRSLARSYEPPVRRLFLPGGHLRGSFSQHRFDALVSFTFNLGVGSVRCAPGFATMCAAIRSGVPSRVASAMLLYDRAGGRRLLGLTRRRHAERALFERPMSRFELWPAVEARLVRHFDRLRGHRSRSAAARRAVLRAQLRARATRIARRARAERDWLTRRRIVRFDALDRRAGDIRTIPFRR